MIGIALEWFWLRDIVQSREDVLHSTTEANT